MMRVRITCADGIAKHARVVNADTGEQIPGIYEATWRGAVGDAATLELRIHPALCDVTCEWRPDAISDRMVKAAAWAIGQQLDAHRPPAMLEQLARAALEHAIDPDGGAP
jgi:hypothetical protein